MVKQGYKNTSVGIIPIDWEVKTLGEIIDSTQLGGNYQNDEIERQYPLIKMGNLNRGFINTDKILHINQGITPAKQDKLVFGDLLFNTRNTLELVGKVAIWRNELAIAYFNSNIMRISFNQKYVGSNFYMNLILNTSKSILQLKAIATGTTSVSAIYSRDLIKIEIPIPPLPEQVLIAKALSDTDELIANLESLILKKQLIKQGTMQQLLQPKHGWEVKRLGEVAEICTGKKNNQDKIESGLFSFFVRSQTVEKINSYSFDGEAILIPGEGNIGKIFHYINGKFDYHQRVYKISDFRSGYYGKYIYRYISEYFGKHAMENSVKATVDSLRLPTFKVFEIPFPSTIKEQIHIATILSDMDNEITLLESKLHKYRNIKQGMMQSLLTGQIRLV